MTGAIEELKKVFYDSETQRVLANARMHLQRPSAARLIRIAGMAEVVLEAEGEEGD